jgi:hypothetical protein
MSDMRPQSLPRFGTVLLGALLGFVALARAADVTADPLTAPAPAASEVFGFDTDLGRITYDAGRGLRLGRTGFTLGGFATAEVEAPEGGGSNGGADGNLFVFFDPISFFHVFSELEFGNLATIESGSSGIRSDPEVEVERLYLDLDATDAAHVRFGQFFTPVGRWNLTHAEPFVWTTTEPVIVEDVFDEIVTGAMLWGSLFPPNAALSYSLYGTFLDHMAPDPDAPPAERSLGAHLEWASLHGWAVGLSYFASKRPDDDWHNLGGIDGLWQPHPRVELTGEAIFGEGSQENGALWGLYTQAVVETVRTLYVVGRYEHFDPPRHGRTLNLFDVGLTWVPRYYLRLKADYRFANHNTERAPAGFFSSVSILF